MTAYVDGAAVPLETAIAEAARLLGAARLPLVAGLQTDVAGARAAILLAEKLRGAYDHAASDALLRDIGVLRQAGRMVTTANDVRLRADTVLLIGPRLTALWPELAERLALKEPPRLSADKAARKIFWLGGEPGAAESSATVRVCAAALSGVVCAGGRAPRRDAAAVSIPDPGSVLRHHAVFESHALSRGHQARGRQV